MLKCTSSILSSFKCSPFLQVLASVFPYEEAAILCGGSLPSYISKVSPVDFLYALSLLVPNLHSTGIIDRIHLNVFLVNTIPVYFLVLTQGLQKHFLSLDLLTSSLCDTPWSMRFKIHILELCTAIKKLFLLKYYTRSRIFVTR
jgi:hypothetical protein